MKLVRCQVLKNSDGLFEADIRYISVEEFHLWKYLMEAKHGLHVAASQVMLWVDKEEYTSHRAFYDRFPRIPVTRVSFLNPCEGLETLCPVTRYLPTERAAELTRLLVRHYRLPEGEAPDIVKKAGYCLVQPGEDVEPAVAPPPPKER
ncbi:MAG: hypothetical protein COZ33_02010 [Nitrospirae bacterium CG_4_10_14_3_um_filter_70_108]|nr:MAG: hypothetical protein COZ33_02010 [Nitrospirae bacterium CG_4_10_14_3_um_filter_70_108]